MASFYRTNEEWVQGEELPLLDLDDVDSQAQQPLNTFFDADHHKLIYIYDFLNLWTFFIELMEVGEPAAGIEYPNLIFGQGEVPEEAPEKTPEEATQKDVKKTGGVKITPTPISFFNYRVSNIKTSNNPPFHQSMSKISK